MIKEIKPKLNLPAATQEADQTISNKWFLAFKKIVTEVVLVSMVLSLITPALIYPEPARASNPTGAPPVTKQYPPKPTEVQVHDASGVKVIQDESGKTQAEVKKGTDNVTEAQKKDTKELTKWEVFKKNLDKMYQKLRNAVKVAAAEAFSYMLNTFAYDTATWLASGGEGQQPMFFTEDWGEYLTNLVDNAAGTFLEKLGNNSWINLNLCTPSLGLKISIGLGLGNLRRPKQPDCTVTKMIKNWKSWAESPNFLSQFDDIFDPKSNDIGIAAKAFGLYYQKVEEDWLAGIFRRKEGEGFKSVGDSIADTILTPGTVTAEGAKQLTRTETGSKGEEVKVEYGNIFNIAIATFINTLLGKLFERLFKKGLVSSKDDKTIDLSGLGNLLARGATNQDLYTGESGIELYSGEKAARLRFLDLLQAGAKQGGAYDVLTKLVYCSDPENPGPDECAIKQDFRSAIERKLTLREAIDQGLIDGNAPFGFMDWDASALYRGISYRSITILRTFRVVPVGWEIAAQTINKFDPGKTYSLNDLIARFADESSDNLFYGLIDPEWVLTLPDHFCKLEGYGSKVVYEGVIGGDDANSDGDFTDANDVPPQRTVGRAEYCADYQSCLQKDESGNCQYYGYCTEERRIWDLQGKGCKPYFNTCQTFQRSDNKVFSFLENTLDFNGCSADNAGCQWYCQVFNPSSDIWTCTNEHIVIDPATGAIDAERVLKPCNLAGGCLVSTSCEIAEGDSSCVDNTNGTNLSISNSCNSGSRWWVGDKCIINPADALCTIKQGDVGCTLTGCESFANLLLNPSFETAASPGNLADKWSTSSGSLTYFERAAGASERIHAGKNSLRFFSYGLSVNETVSAAELELPVGNYYTFSGYVYDYLNAGAITLEVGGSGVTSAQSRVSTKGNGWQLLTFDFLVDKESSPGSGKGKVQVKIIVSGDQVGGTAWFDDFRITQSCVVENVTLTLIGTVGVNESKIHLDRDAQSCDAQNVGCSELIRTLPNFGTNLVPNSSFEDWSDPSGVPQGWQTGENWNSANTSFEQAEGYSDNYSLKLIKKTISTNDDNFSRDFEIPLFALKPNTTYRVSFMARSDQDAAASDRLWYTEILSNHNPDYYCSLDQAENCYIGTVDENEAHCTSLNKGHCVFDYDGVFIGSQRLFPLTDEWQQFVSASFTTRHFSYDFKFSISSHYTNPAKPLYIDNVQVEEVETNNAAVSSYSDYGTKNLVYLKKPPATLACHGYTIDRPSPDVLTGVNQTQCNGENMVWRKFCANATDATDAGEACTNNGECDSNRCNPQGANGCDASGQFCCHYTDWPECSNFAMYCQEDEVGCELYRPVLGGQSIPAKVSIQDYCPAECVGYEAYKQSTSHFESQESLEYFIPKTAKSCTASQVGCTEFTNLDEVARGGEGKEYYQYLRQCRKPDQSDANCQNFYNWQGSDETGYQLKLYNLTGQTPSGGAPLEVNTDPTLWPTYWCEVKTDSGTNGPDCCDGPEDLAANPFCKEFYAASGEIYYRIYANTISCSDDCHPLRQTRLEKDESLARANCDNTKGTWEGDACVYHAIPQEGTRCSASAAGCREYRGNAGGNIFTAFADNFESGDTVGWRFGAISSEALSITGHSIKTQLLGSDTDSNGTIDTYDKRVVTSWASLWKAGTTEYINANIVSCTDTNSTDVPFCDTTHTSNCYDLQLGKCIAKETENNETCYVALGEKSCGVMGNVLLPSRTYLISFWAKNASGVADITLDLLGAVDPAPLATISLSPEWNYYSLGPFTTRAQPDFDLSARLRFIGSVRDSNPDSPSLVDFYVDNVEIKEVADYVYVIKNSWQTPASCDTNPWTLPQPTPAPQFMLGCKQYLDSYSRTHNLKSFTNLCRLEAVGCEALIDTFNLTSPFAKVFNENDANSDVSIPADRLVYLVNRTNYQCPSTKKGCQAVGQPTINVNQEAVNYKTAYLINDPNQYSSSLCSNPEVGCEEWSTGNGFSYFKDPGQRVCEYRLAPGQTQSNWFKFGSSAQTGDCPLVQPSVGVPHPTDNWVGLCASEASSCNQFIDPVSLMSKNLVFNADFKTNVVTTDTPDVPDGWQANLTTDGLVQSLSLQHGNLYTLSFTSNKNLSLADNDLHFEIRNCPQITSFDHSLNNVCINTVTGEPVQPQKLCQSDDNCDVTNHQICSTNVLVISQGAYTGDSRTSTQIDNFPQNQISYSGRVFVTRDCNAKIMITNVGGTIESIIGTAANNYTDGLVKEVALRKTDINYVLADSVDKRSCNGIVDPERYCVLFNDRSEVNYKLGEDDFSYLGFDADVSGINVNNGLPVLQCAGNCDSNAVLNVRPDRTCETWLACNSYATVVNAEGGEERQCLNLGLCNLLADDGSCLNFLETSHGDARKDFYQEPEQIQNLSGYSKAGLEVSDTFNKTIYGYYPYVEMSQEGGATSITNSNFDSVFSEGKEPLGWAEYESKDSQGWQNFKYTIGTDFNSALEGGYLQLNTFYQVVSEDVDLEKGTNYILGGWINTLELKHNNLNDSQLFTQICYKLNNQLDLTCPPELKVFAGLGWQYVTATFNSAGSTALKIVLKNNAGDILACRDGHEDTACAISGYSLLDEILLKPVLKVKNQTPDNLRDFIARSCRLYPDFDSLACQYFEENVLHRGIFGYCLTQDPNNLKQCLQWWPVDQIGGQLTDEILAYNIQSPLYYCVEKGERQIFSEDTEFSFLVSDFSGNFTDAYGLSAQLVPFEISEDYRPAFRYPYVRQFSVRPQIFPRNDWLIPGVGFRLLALGDTLIEVNIFGDQGLKNDPFDLTIGPTGNRGILLAPWGVLVAIPVEMLYAFIAADHGALDMDAHYIGEMNEGIESLGLGEILPDNAVELNLYFIWSWPNGINPENIGRAESTIQTLRQVGDIAKLLLALGGASANSAQHDDAWEEEGVPVFGILEGEETSLNIVFGSLVGVKIATEQDPMYSGIAEDPVPDIPGDIYGGIVVMVEETTDGDLAPGMKLDFIPSEAKAGYCQKLVQVVTTAGNNKAWTGRVQSGSSYILSDAKSQKNYFLYYDPFDYNEMLEAAEECYGVCNVNGQYCEILGPGSECPCPMGAPQQIAQECMNGKCYDWSGSDANTIPTSYDCTGDPPITLNGECDTYLPLTNETPTGDCILDATCIGGKKEGNSCETDDDCTDYSPACFIYQSSDFQPFGAMVPPAESQYPENWDSRVSTYRQPLFYEPPLISLAEPYQARMGEDHTADSLMRIFLKTYGVWSWDEGESDLAIDDHYEPLDPNDPDDAVDLLNYSWNIVSDWDNTSKFPDAGYCTSNIRPVEPTPPTLDDVTLCRIRPIIDPLNISINNSRSTEIGNGDPDAVISGAGSIKLSFTVKVDPNQLPIGSYSVDWGDGEVSSVNGVSLRARPNVDNPLTLYHAYDFWQLRRRCNDVGASCTDEAAWDDGTSMLYCPDENSCRIRLRIKVRDNWNAETCLPGLSEVNCAVSRCNTSLRTCNYSNPCPSGELCLPDNKYIPLLDYILVQPRQ